jgi:hypothetical protein
MATEGGFLPTWLIHSHDICGWAIYTFASWRGRIDMSSEAYRTIRNQVRQLSADEQFQLLEDLVVMLWQGTTRKSKHSIRELEGLGKEVWKGVDVEEYIRQERGSCGG